MIIEVMRLSHRIRRDPRISTHVALTARAFGASKIFYSGDKDSSMENSIIKVTAEFGGPFEIEYIKNPLSLVEEKKKQGFLIIHATMYGLELKKEVKNLRKDKILIIIGSEKVPFEFYELADYNISVTSQPISEVSALSTLLYELNNHSFKEDFQNAKQKVIPEKLGKKIVSN